MDPKNPPIPSPNASSFTFADFSQIGSNQVAAKAFGPDTVNPTTKFRITSSFNVSNDVDAYAVVDGFVMIQPCTSSTVNLILRPYKQPGLQLVPIKYYIILLSHPLILLSQ